MTIVTSPLDGAKWSSLDRGRDRDVSRFIRSSDGYTNEVIVSLPKPWWSRPYEYDWAACFYGPKLVMLDAACGISHPFKFWMAQHSVWTDVYACDRDPRILSNEAILADVAQDLQPDLYQLESIRAALSKLQKKCCDITELPYTDGKFDRIFCISVLEHMERMDIVRALREFRRVLKPKGLVVLTFDVPPISTTTLVNVIEASGLMFAGDHSFELPADALHTEMYGGLYCFRAVLKVRS